MSNWSRHERLRRVARHDLLVESQAFHQQPAATDSVRRTDPVALLIALLQTPHRFRTKRQLWADACTGLRDSHQRDYGYPDGQLRRSKKVVSIRGLNKDHNHDLKGLFKATATMASNSPAPGTVSRVSPGIAGQRDEASYGSSRRRETL